MPPRRIHVTLVSLALAACAPTVAPVFETAAQVEEYRRAFERQAGEWLGPPQPPTALFAALRGARVLWLGDHHRSSRLHVRQRALLAELQAARIDMVLALEAIGQQDEPAVRDFLDGRLDLTALRVRMQRRWERSWLDARDVDAGHYRNLLRFARRTATPVVGLEPTPRLPLERRDDAIAAAVQRAAAAWPDRLVVAIVGQAHLLGSGALVRRTGLPAVAIGGEPTPALRRLPVPSDAREALYRGDCGLWWFGELLDGAR